MPHKVISYVFIFLATLLLTGHDIIPHHHGICHHISCEAIESNSHNLFHSIQDVLGQGQECSINVNIEQENAFSFAKCIAIIAVILGFLFFRNKNIHNFFIKNERKACSFWFSVSFTLRGPPSFC